MKMAKRILLILSIVALMVASVSVVAFAATGDVNTADFSGINANSSYTSRNFNSGWKAVNAAVMQGGTSDNNPTFKMYGDSSVKAVTLNGKTTAVGKLTSPTLTGGISELTFNYGNPFAESNGVDITISIMQDGAVVDSYQLDDNSVTKLVAETYTWTLAQPIEGDFVLEFKNNSPSKSTSNKDRVSLWNISWISYEAPTGELTPAEQVAYVADKVTFPAEFTESKTLDNILFYGNPYYDVAVKWTSDSENVVFDHGEETVTVTVPEAGADDEVVNITASVELEGVEPITKTFTVTLVAPMSEGEIVDAAFALTAGQTLAGGPYTLTGVINKIVTAYSSQYKNVTVDMTVYNSAGEEKTIQAFRLAGTGADTIEVGNWITVTGNIKNYNGTIEFDAGCSLDAYGVPELSDAEKVEFELGVIDILNIFVGDGTYNVATAGSTYADVVISWASDDDSIVVEDGVLTITRPEQTITVTLMATATLNGATATKEFDVTVMHAGELTNAEIVDAAYMLNVGQALIGNQTLTGIITKIDAAYDSSYGNISVIIAVEGTENTMLCYRMKGTGANTIKVGDIITVTGNIKNYNGKIEFDQGCSLDSYTTPITIEGAALNINNNIDMMYYVAINGEPTDVSATFKFCGISTTVTEYTIGEDGRYCFVFKGITPDLMGLNVEITVSATYAAATAKATDNSMSVRTYYEIAKEYCAENTALLTLMSDVLVYGAAVQTWIGDNEDELVTYGLELTPSTTEFVAPETMFEVYGEAFKSAALVLGSTITVRFTVAAAEDAVIRVALNDKVAEYNVADLKTDAEGNYIVEFENVYASEYDNAIWASIVGTNECVRYSVNSYISEMATNEDLADLVKALYIYGATADAYN